MKVSDLLHNPGSEDEIVFSEKTIDSSEIVILTPGVSGSIYMQSLNKYSLRLVIESLQCVVEDTSDISGETYTREVVLEDYEVLYVVPQDWVNEDDTYSSFSDVYEIDEKDLCIDIEECITNAIRSQEPIVKRKNDEELWDWWNNDENDYDDTL
jgi:hypothetical protein